MGQYHSIKYYKTEEIIHTFPLWASRSRQPGAQCDPTERRPDMYPLVISVDTLGIKPQKIRVD